MKALNINNSDRVSFSRIAETIETPDLLNIQVESWKNFLQSDVAFSKRKKMGLQEVFLVNFPVLDTRETMQLEFVGYNIENPHATIQECVERGLSYTFSLKAKLRIVPITEEAKDVVDSVEQEVYLGNIPQMTERGTFIINGIERTIVSQLHRSPGIVFGESTHTNGIQIYSARIIPFRGAWVEFTTDIHNTMYVYIDRKKKFFLTTLLRAIGFPSDEDILKTFDLIESVDIKKVDLKDYIGRKIASDAIDRKTGEIVISKDQEFTEDIWEYVSKLNLKTLYFYKDGAESSIIVNTIRKDAVRSEEDALVAIYQQYRSVEAPDLNTARSLVEKLFFNPKRYDLGEVGRMKLNDRLGLNISNEITVLTKEDIITIIKFLIELREGKQSVDDIDHLGNRRIKTVGEQVGQQINIGIVRMARSVRERMNLREKENLVPQALVHARAITSVVNSFFGTSQMSQFLDQTNPLAEITHKRRTSALGPGGLSRERAGFEVRDVHYTHYGRLCPIETPEGPNIGLISSLCVYSRVNELGFIETPYRKVQNGKITDDIEYLSADKEDDFIIAQANENLSEKGKFTHERVRARHRGDFPIEHPENIQYMDVMPSQIVSPAAALIPFLEHDDANRALMGSNMQRQAVPLLQTEAPIVGTGFERKIARDSRTLIIAERDGLVLESDAEKIIVQYNIDEKSVESLTTFEELHHKEYKLKKFAKTNQETCITQKPLVYPGQKIKKGDILADGCATDKGDLALGKNLLVAFMPWNGYNFEDAIIMSERIVSEDIFTSIHIEEFDSQVRDTKRGEEEFTREIPNVGEDATRNLDETGLIRIGAEVREGDYLIGKITPKAETEASPEEKLLRAVFGEKAGDVKDASLKAPPGMKGVVIGTQLFGRKRKDTEYKLEEQKILKQLDEKKEQDLGNAYVKLQNSLGILLSGEKSIGIRYLDGEIAFRSGKVFAEDTFDNVNNLENFDYKSDWVEDKRKNNILPRIFENYFAKVKNLEIQYKHDKVKFQIGDNLPPGILQLAKVYVAKKRKLSVGDKMAGRHGNKGVVAKIVPREDMPFFEDGTQVDIVLNPLGVPSRMNIGQLFETALGWAGKKLGVKYSTPIFDGATWEEIQKELDKSSLPNTSKSLLYDGRTGEAFEQKVTVGQIYIMKLSHLVDDKIHARSIGPYSLITQQPLGGKAQFGGQRFGEMEVWAIEAYGASNILQELLTVKSDDVNGRAKVYEALVKGENLPDANIPESFNVLVKELQGLGLEIVLD